MIRRASKLREKKVEYIKPRRFSNTRRKAKIALLGEQAMKTLDSETKLTFERNAKDWRLGKSPPDIPQEAVKRLSRTIIRIYGEIKLGFDREQMIKVRLGLRKVRRKGLQTKRPKKELQEMDGLVSKIYEIAMSQAKSGGIMEEYGRSIIMNSDGTDITWKDRSGSKGHVKEYTVPKKELLRLVRFAAYEAAVNVAEANGRIKKMINYLKSMEKG